jgi:hypothetical protein
LSIPLLLQVDKNFLNIGSLTKIILFVIMYYTPKFRRNIMNEKWHQKEAVERKNNPCRK